MGQKGNKEAVRRESRRGNRKKKGVVQLATPLIFAFFCLSGCGSIKGSG